MFWGEKIRNLVLDMLSRRCLLYTQLERPIGRWIYEFRGEVQTRREDFQVLSVWFFKAITYDEVTKGVTVNRETV